jgi:hypothetical protein
VIVLGKRLSRFENIKSRYTLSENIKSDQSPLAGPGQDLRLLTFPSSPVDLGLLLLLVRTRAFPSPHVPGRLLFLPWDRVEDGRIVLAG